jgi:hypothetical protein
MVEALEDRLAPATFAVTNNNNSGPGSLRQAIQSANANPGPDSITFHIGSGYTFIAPSSPLPTITDAVAIKGATQPGFSGSPLIELEGSGLGAVNGLVLTASGCSVDGLVIVGFGGYGIDIQGGAGNAITRCDIGVIPFGIEVPNGAGGVLLAHAAHGNRIGGAGAGNIISGNNGDGVDLIGPGTSGNIIASNLIGTTVDGTTVTTDSSGHASFTAVLPFSGAPGKVISATATAVTGSNTAANLTFGDTSEFAGDLTAF